MKTAVIILSVFSVIFLAALMFAVYRLIAVKKAVGRRDEFDSMTNMPTRDGFMRKGQEMLTRSDGETALIIFDVDRLRLINTLFGTDAGDSVIAAFGETVRSIARKGDVAGRVDTDDFALLTRLCGRTPKDVIDEFSQALAKFVPDCAVREKVELRAGICLFDGEDDIYTLFNKANLCLLTQAENQRISEFTADMESRMVENELLRSEMLEALDEGQFELYYQPKVSFRTGEIKGVEALIRWHHPVKGFVPPNEFIPLAEQFGIITRIDEWGLREACRQGKRWRDAGLPPVTISVNMSQAQFADTDVYSTIVNTLKETGFDPRLLEIEVTETMAMTDVDRTVSVLNKIHELGVSISMDDFGTGYSSLASLKTIPFDILKIDRSLVCDVNDNDASRRITGAIVAMGKALKMVVLAEGVETNEQSRLLTDLGCDYAQGYYYSKPVPANEIETLLILPIKQSAV